MDWLSMAEKDRDGNRDIHDYWVFNNSLNKFEPGPPYEIYAMYLHSKPLFTGVAITCPDT